jgi:hypothetical protein
MGQIDTCLSLGAAFARATHKVLPHDLDLNLTEDAATVQGAGRTVTSE